MQMPVSSVQNGEIDTKTACGGGTKIAPRRRVKLLYHFRRKQFCEALCGRHNFNVTPATKVVPGWRTLARS